MLFFNICAHIYYALQRSDVKIQVLSSGHHHLAPGQHGDSAHCVLTSKMRLPREDFRFEVRVKRAAIKKPMLT